MPDLEELEVNGVDYDFNVKFDNTNVKLKSSNVRDAVREIVTSKSFTIPASAWKSSSGVYKYTVDANVSSGDLYTWFMQPSNGQYITDEDIELDLALRGMQCTAGKITFIANQNISKAITIVVEGDV